MTDAIAELEKAFQLRIQLRQCTTFISPSSCVFFSYFMFIYLGRGAADPRSIKAAALWRQVGISDWLLCATHFRDNCSRLCFLIHSYGRIVVPDTQVNNMKQL